MIRSCVGKNEFRFIRWRSDDRVDVRRASDGIFFPNVPTCMFTEDIPGEIESEARRLKSKRRMVDDQKIKGGLV